MNSANDQGPANAGAAEKPGIEPPLSGISDTTARAYDRVAARLAARFLREGGAPGHGAGGVDPMSFIDWVIALKPAVARNTWRQYKAATVHALATNGDLVAADTLRQVSSTGSKTKGERTSATKKKGFPARDRDRIIRWLLARQAVNSVPLVAWIRAGILTGLRPCEWPGSRYIDVHPETGGAALIVANAKATHGRANGPQRTIFLQNRDGMSLPPQDLAVIRAHSEYCRELATTGPDQFGRFYNNCRNLMSQASRAVWPRRQRHYTLYSCRHQFSANAKKVTTREGVAALMGHASDATAAANYARATQASSGDLPLVPVPHPNEVATVRHEPTRAERQQAQVKPRTAPEVATGQ